MNGTRLCGLIAPLRIAAASPALRNDPQMRQAFINQVAGPIVNKMFECGMAPEVARRNCLPMALAMKCFRSGGSASAAMTTWRRAPTNSAKPTTR